LKVIINFAILYKLNYLSIRITSEVVRPPKQEIRRISPEIFKAKISKLFLEITSALTAVLPHVVQTETLANLESPPAEQTDTYDSPEEAETAAWHDYTNNIQADKLPSENLPISEEKINNETHKFETAIKIGLEEGLQINSGQADKWMYDAAWAYLEDHPESITDPNVSSDDIKKDIGDNIFKYIHDYGFPGNVEHPLFENSLALDLSVNRQKIGDKSKPKFFFGGGFRLLIDPAASTYGIDGLGIHGNVGLGGLSVEGGLQTKIFVNENNQVQAVPLADYGVNVAPHVANVKGTKINFGFIVHRVSSFSEEQEEHNNWESRLVLVITPGKSSDAKE